MNVFIANTTSSPALLVKSYMKKEGLLWHIIDYNRRYVIVVSEYSNAILIPSAEQKCNSQDSKY